MCSVASASDRHDLQRDSHVAVRTRRAGSREAEPLVAILAREREAHRLAPPGSPTTTSSPSAAARSSHTPRAARSSCARIASRCMRSRRGSKSSRQQPLPLLAPHSLPAPRQLVERASSISENTSAAVDRAYDPRAEERRVWDADVRAQGARPDGPEPPLRRLDRRCSGRRAPPRPPPAAPRDQGSAGVAVR